MPPVLLDIDADFIVGNGDGDDVARPEVTGREYGRHLRHFKKQDTEVHLMIDHHESLFHWDNAGVRGATCIHIDAHHDMWDVPDVEEPIVRRTLVDFQDDPRRGLRSPEQIDCGNYLHQAMIDGIVKRVIYVPSPFRDIDYEEDDIYCEMGDRADQVEIRTWETFKANRKRLPKADIITVAISPEWTPRSLWGEIKDLCDELGIPPKIVRAKKRKAVRKWKSKSCPAQTDLELDFKFPYVARII